MQTLKITEFGNAVLRQKARQPRLAEIKSQKIQQLIKNMRYTLVEQKLGVGLAAPQVGEGIALSVIDVRPTKNRPKVKLLELVIINPRIIETFGYRTQMWEGCISAGKSGLFAKTPRYKKIKAEFLDEKGRQHSRLFVGLPAQIIQHEIDHLNGVLFMDHVKDTKTYMTMKEYKKMVKINRKKSGKQM